MGHPWAEEKALHFYVSQPHREVVGGGRGWSSIQTKQEEFFPMYCTESFLISTQREVLFRLEAKILMMFGFPLFFLGPLSFYPQPYTVKKGSRVSRL
jgi:hypothetical protein